MGRQRQPPGPKGPRPRSPRVERFIAEYLVDLNGTRAAKAAGYSAKTAAAAASRMLRNVNVAAAVEQGKADRARRTEITADRVLDETAALSFSNLTDYLVDDDGNVSPAPGAPANVMAAIASIKRKIRVTTKGKVKTKNVEVELRLWDKPGVLKLAGRHVAVAGFFDKLELTGRNGGPLEVRSVQDLTSGERRKRIAELLAKRDAKRS